MTTSEEDIKRNRRESAGWWCHIGWWRSLRRFGFASLTRRGRHFPFLSTNLKVLGTFPLFFLWWCLYSTLVCSLVFLFWSLLLSRRPPLFRCTILELSTSRLLLALNGSIEKEDKSIFLYWYFNLAFICSPPIPRRFLLVGDQTRFSGSSCRSSTTLQLQDCDQ